MGKQHCSRCGKKTEGKKYNPYNETFKNNHFGPNEWVTEGHYCLKCATVFINDRNKCKGGHWLLDKTDLQKCME